MNNDADQNNAKPSWIKPAVIVLFSTAIGGGVCGLLIVFLFGTSVMSQILNSVYPPVEDINRFVTQTVDPIVSTRSPLEIKAMIAEATNLTNQGEYELAVPLWTEIISMSPGVDTAYYGRALCYYRLLPQEHDMQQYETYLRSALADMDQAITLRPDKGDYYAFRHEVINGFSGIEEYRVNRQALARLAQENAGAAITLGYTNEYPFTDRVYVADFTTLEQCNQALVGIERMLDATAPDNTSITGLYTMRAEARACLGRYEEAVQDVNVSLQNPNNPIAKAYRKGLYLYQLGELEQALAVLNESITSKPTFQGYRYYLRALIYYDLGKKELASADLETGSSYTWERTGVYAYLLGKMALDDGRQAEGIELFQTAEATLDSNCMLIRSRILEELARLGAEPLSIRPSITIASTPIPVNQP